MTSTPKAAPDPDPRPTVSSSDGQESQAAKKQAQKRVAKQYGRDKTLLASQNESKNTSIGGNSLLGR